MESHSAAAAARNNGGFSRHGFLLALRYLSPSSHCVISLFVVVPAERGTFEDADGQRRGGRVEWGFWRRRRLAIHLPMGGPQDSARGVQAKLAAPARQWIGTFAIFQKSDKKETI